MSVLSVQRENDGTLILLGDHLDVRCANELYNDLDKALTRKPKKIIFDTGNLTRVDTATLQLLVACIRQAKQLNKTVSWLDVNNEFRECAKISGMIEALELQ